MQGLLNAIHQEFRGDVRCDEPMNSHTSWRIGGPAELFLVPEDGADLQVLLQLLERFRVPWLVMGHGTNLLVADTGVRGAVISLERFNSVKPGILGRLELGAGVSLGDAVRQAETQGLLGLKSLAGIPGTVAGALMTNVRRGEREFVGMVEKVSLMTPAGEDQFDCADNPFSSETLPEQGVITSVLLRLQREGWGTPQESDTEPVTTRTGGAHAGAVFRDPRGQRASTLIDEAGLRGERVGYAEFSSWDSNCIVNLGEATAEDVLSLIALARTRVKAEAGVDLELSVRLVGTECAG